MRYVLLTLTILTGLTSHALAQRISHCADAEAAYRSGDHSGAISKFNQCISERNLDAVSRAYAVLNRGRCYLAMGQSDKALGDIRSAIQSYPALGNSDTAAQCMGVDSGMAARLLDTIREE